MTWRDRAVCKGLDTHLFFANQEQARRRAREPAGIYGEAAKICALCPVREPCWQAAVVEAEWSGFYGRQYGFRGGKTPGEQQKAWLQLSNAERLRARSLVLTGLI